MKTLDYLNLNEARVANVVTALQNLLADFQIYYTNLRVFIGKLRAVAFLSFTISLKACTMMRQLRLMR